MLEIHLFVNPLGLGCINCEQSLLTIDHDISTKINYQFIPLLNMQTISETMSLYQESKCGLALRNHTAQVLMQVAMDYEAALFQGRRRARLYLLQLQKALLNNSRHYSSELAQKTAVKAKLDIDMFLEDRQSALAKRSFKRHQQFASGLGVFSPSTAVVVDTDNPKYSLLVDNFDMRTLIDAYRNHQLDNQVSPASLAKQLSLFTCVRNKKN